MRNKDFFLKTVRDAWTGVPDCLCVRGGNILAYAFYLLPILTCVRLKATVDVSFAQESTEPDTGRDDQDCDQMNPGRILCCWTREIDHERSASE